MEPTKKTSPVITALNQPATIRRRKWRIFKDKLAAHSMTVGGISVIIAICLIFFYLLYIVYPLLMTPNMDKQHQYTTPKLEAGETFHLAIEEKNRIGVRFTKQAHAIFFDLNDGKTITDYQINIPVGTNITSFAVADLATDVIGFGLSDGSVVIVKHVYDLDYSEFETQDVRIIPRIEYPLGEEPIVIDEQAQALIQLDIQLGEENNIITAITADNHLKIKSLAMETSFLDDTTFVNFDDAETGELLLQATITHILLDKEQRTIFLADEEGQISYIDINDITEPTIMQRLRVVEIGQEITAIEFLTGDISLLIGDSEGRISQWFLVRDDNNNNVLTKIRQFHQQRFPITSIAIEERRKGFVAADNIGQVGFYHTTSHRNLMLEALTESPLTHITISPRADVLIAEDKQHNLQVWHINNEHPEVSWASLWGKVWYESYQEPAYIWQSSSASNDFEPKFSLTPLAFGTLKAAFYAMLIAVPLSILGAIYTAYFMAPKMRSMVKPTIEIMAALPTVILGFLAGLWLAPVLESNMPGMFLLIFLLPIGVLMFAYIWRYVPAKIRHYIPAGWEATLLIPIILFVSWLSFTLSSPLELLIFNGNMPQWLTSELGISFDQRNAIIVGVAMGLAVIPNIFSIAEDAVFSVPKHLTMGSLALGATPWQTMVRVVILTASPGIFSAVMIGMGRAVGETMIVLMATGNTPIMDFNIFQGLRTLAANIAVEIPESEVASTHFRILFLSALVLFIFTFFLNTLAEIVRHRLRRKYSSL
ncbi:MAG: ABC transporter permease subunit [Thiomargarita sp.]|nr:ABC transporter permease subunit [Thiomargarita sp.]